MGAACSAGGEGFTQTGAVSAASGQAVVGGDPAALHSKGSDAIALRGQILVVGRAAGVPDQHRGPGLYRMSYLHRALRRTGSYGNSALVGGAGDLLQGGSGLGRPGRRSATGTRRPFGLGAQWSCGRLRQCVRWWRSSAPAKKNAPVCFSSMQWGISRNPTFRSWRATMLDC